MSKQENSPAAGSEPDELPVAESHLGHVLALIHRVLPRLDEPNRAGEVQAALRQAASLLEAAREAHAQTQAAGPGASLTVEAVSPHVEPEIAAVIAAAVAVLFDRPCRLVSVQPAATPAPHFNVWALEGRTQIFQSHKVR